MFNLKIVVISLLTLSCSLAQAQGPSSILEFDGGPTAKLSLTELEEIKAYAFDANTSIVRLLAKVTRLENSPVAAKEDLKKSIAQLIKESKDKRSVLLLSHALQAGMTLVNLIERQAIDAGFEHAPQGIVDQQFRILKQSLIFARDYYVSDYAFIEGVLTTQEEVSNPKFVEFGVKLTQFTLKMSNGVVNARSNYGMVRWSLAVLANYIRRDKNVGVAYASTQTNIVATLLEKNIDNTPVFPDLVNGEAAPSDIDCIMKTRDLKFLAQSSFKEIEQQNAAMVKKHD